jgi:hypothetical protein
VARGTSIVAQAGRIGLPPRDEQNEEDRRPVIDAERRAPPTAQGVVRHLDRSGAAGRTTVRTDLAPRGGQRRGQHLEMSAKSTGWQKGCVPASICIYREYGVISPNPRSTSAEINAQSRKTSVVGSRDPGRPYKNACRISVDTRVLGSLGSS